MVCQHGRQRYLSLQASRAVAMASAVTDPRPGTADAVLPFRTAPFGDLGLSPEARDWIFGKITPLPSQLAGYQLGALLDVNFGDFFTPPSFLANGAREKNPMPKAYF